MNTQSLKTYLALNHVHGLGPVRFAKLLAHFQTCEAILNSHFSTLCEHGLPPKLAHQVLHPDWEAAAQDLAWRDADPNHHIITWEDSHYPKQLSHISDPPPILYIKGDPQHLAQPQIAIVGSRNPSGYGRHHATQFAHGLAEKGYTITSGLAIGIDACAHQAAVNLHQPTIAVLGHGLNSLYPAKHRALAAQIIQHGALVSEFAPDAQPLAVNFPRRNRIISGLSLGVLIVEAALKSGSLVTARFAMEQNREVFAVPGAINNPLAQGCHALIRQGAKLVENLEDILEELPRIINSVTSDNTTAISLARAKPSVPPDLEPVFAAIAFTETPFDWIVETTGLSAATIAAKLAHLLVHGYVVQTSGGYARNIEGSNDQ